MKTLRFVMFLFYRYYSKGETKGIAYFSTLCAIALLFFIHILQILILFDAIRLLPISENESRIIKYVKIAAMSVPVFIILSLFAKEKDIRNAVYDEARVKRANLYLISYVVFSVALLFLLMFLIKPK